MSQILRTMVLKNISSLTTYSDPEIRYTLPFITDNTIELNEYENGTWGAFALTSPTKQILVIPQVNFLYRLRRQVRGKGARTPRAPAGERRPPAASLPGLLAPC